MLIQFVIYNFFRAVDYFISKIYINNQVLHLLRHKKSIHKEVIDKNAAIDFLCTHCDHKTKDFDRLKGHFTSKHKGEEMTCQISDPKKPKDEADEERANEY